VRRPPLPQTPSEPATPATTAIITTESDTESESGKGDKWVAVKNPAIEDDVAAEAAIATAIDAATVQVPVPSVSEAVAVAA